jgi:hypothetical protein
MNPEVVFRKMAKYLTLIALEFVPAQTNDVRTHTRHPSDEHEDGSDHPEPPRLTPIADDG